MVIFSLKGKDTYRVLYEIPQYDLVRGEIPLNPLRPFAIAQGIGTSPKPQKQKTNAKTKAKHQKIIILEFEFYFIGMLVMTEKIYRTKEIKVRLTDEEHDQLLKKMTGGQLATWIRKIALSQKIAKPYKNADPKLLASLGRIGGNLNQIAYQANTLDKDTDKLRVFAQLTVIREQLNEVLDSHDR